MPTSMKASKARKVVAGSSPTYKASKPAVVNWRARFAILRYPARYLRLRQRLSASKFGQSARYLYTHQTEVAKKQLAKVARRK